jgi:hypothetical protein
VEDVRGGVAEEKEHLRALEYLVEAGDILAVRLACAVVGVALDLYGQPLGSEQEVQIAAAAVGRTEFGLALGPKARVVQAQARDGLRGGAGVRIGELQPSAAAFRAAHGRFEREGDQGGGRDRRAADASDPPRAREAGW